MECYGANCIYCTDSAGYMLPDDVQRARAARCARLKTRDRDRLPRPSQPRRWASPIRSRRSSAARSVSTAPAGLGAGAGNTPLEVFVAVCDRMGIETGVDVFKIADVAEDLVVPMMDTPVRIDRDALILGYAGVYSSFLLFAKRAEAKYGVPSRDILVELGRRRMVGGQEDMIEDIALTWRASAACSERSLSFVAFLWLSS